MSRDEVTPREERLAALLAAFDDALAAGAPAAVGPDLEEDLQCLYLLNQLRPGNGPLDTDRAPPQDAVVIAGHAPADPGERPPATGPGVRYTLARLHAVGGIGQVWLAHDADLDRDVALKELRPERARNPAIAARFLREARITSRLQHPGIVPVYEMVPGTPGPADGPDTEPPFYTMRFVQGRTFTDAARAYHEKRAAGAVGPLDLTALLNAFVSVCNTVAYAHSRGVIHRDLKGENVVLGDFGEVMVLDWGFAKVLGATEEDAVLVGPEMLGPAEHTLAGQVLGTPAYMAPEQAAGRLDLVDCRTDVYGLGAILYEVLTGRPPFTGADSQEVLRKVREQTPAPPQALCPGVPADLGAVCMRALARNPQDRYTSVAELGREIQHWLADEPVLAYREPLLARLRRWARRHKPIVAALTVLLATAVTALVLGAAVLDREQSRAQADRATADARARRALETRLYYHRIALAERELDVKNLNRANQLLDACPADLRGWEWHCLKRLCHADVLTLTGHQGAVSAVAFSPNGRHLASAGHDRTVRLWDVATGQQVRAFVGHADVVYGLAYSPDGRHLATASWDRSVILWDVQGGRALLRFTEHNEPVLRVAFSPDGKQLVSLSTTKVLVWDATTRAVLHTLGKLDGLNRYGLAYSPDGRHVAVTTHERPVVIWDVAEGKRVGSFAGHLSVVKNVTFSQDGRLVASGAGDLVRSEPGEVRVWEAATGLEVFHLRGHTDPIYGVAFSPDGRRLVSASQDHTAKVWDLVTGQEALTIRAHADTVRAVAFSPDGTRLATACAGGKIKLWDGTPWAEEKPAHEVDTLTGADTPVFSVAFHPDGTNLAAATDREAIAVWEMGKGGQQVRMVPIGLQVFVTAYSPDGSVLATATSDGAIRMLLPATGQLQQKLESHRKGPIKSLAFSPDGRWLASASWDRTLCIWDVAAGRLAHLLEGHADAVTGVAWSPDGQRLASSGYDQTVRLWDAATGKLIRTLTGHTSRVYSVAFSPVGGLLASASNDGTVRLWDAATGQELGPLPRGHASGVRGLAFSPDGRRLASASNDWTVKLWDPVAGAAVGTLRGHTDRVHAVAFSPDGRRLASASADQTVKVWEVP